MNTISFLISYLNCLVYFYRFRWKLIKFQMENFIIKGPTVPINVEKSLGEYFWDRAEKYGNRIFQIDAYTGATETFKDVQRKAVRVAINLKQNGVNPKDVIMICGENNFDNIIPTLAGLFLGAYVANVVPTTDIYGATNYLSDLKPKVLFVSDNKLDIFKEALDVLNLHPQIYTIGSQKSQFKSMNEIYNNSIEEKHNFVPKKVDIHETAFILLSSGTTSKPKGICISHFTILGAHTREDKNRSYDLSDQPFIIFSPLCYISSIWLLSANILFTCPRVIGVDIDVELFLKLVDKYKVTGVFLTYNVAVPLATLDEKIVSKYDLSSVFYVSTGGSFVHPKYISRLMQIFSKAFVVPIYGSTELGTAPFVWKFPSAREVAKTKLNSVGEVNKNCEVKVVDVNTGKALGPNQKGEILVRSPYRMNGYYNQTDQPFDEDGFLHTGDLGQYDEDRCFYILDRLKRSFKYLGNFIYPGLVEERLAQHPLVKEAAVIELPHDADGYRAMACVVLNQGCIATEKELGDFIVKVMGEYSRPAAGFQFLKELPVNNNGKVDFNKLKLMYKTEYGTAT
ncbi:luciferin 4-monooxygenase-like [Anthonomus grandis grandis]|uniref:luciferin 4-monooxygenase-like n=1 Tax=Anthonomus grandis grandis TaxID=2921223 RepID=UPI002165C8A2|nr:luciferin 4-monooxygenase-like [Anthonomus grandis grandis]